MSRRGQTCAKAQQQQPPAVHDMHRSHDQEDRQQAHLQHRHHVHCRAICLKPEAHLGSDILLLTLTPSPSMHCEGLLMPCRALCNARKVTEQQGGACLVQEARRPGQEDANLVHPVGNCIECVSCICTFHREAYGRPCAALCQSIHKAFRAETSWEESWNMKPMPVTYHIFADTSTSTSLSC